MMLDLRCKACGRVFRLPEYTFNYTPGRGQFCSKTCRQRFAQENWTDRFWAKVAFNGVGCWLWTASRTPNGYGKFGNKGAHRVVWELTHGPISPGLCVLHKCDNPPCVRPDHLFLGTNAANTADMFAKGRQTHMRRHARLTPAQVRDIRSRSHESIATLADAFGLSWMGMYKVVKGLNWKDV